MARTLPSVAHQHHERLERIVDSIPSLADALLRDAALAHSQLVALRGDLHLTLVPHMEAAEHTLYPVLEQLFQNRHSMTPMRREHEEVRRLIASLGSIATSEHARHPIGQTLGLRRSLFRLYALLKCHLAEEEVYLRILEHGVNDETASLLAAAIDHPGAPVM